MRFIKLSHCAYHCDYHVIIASKYRRKVFNEGIFAYFKDKIDEVRKRYPLIGVREINQDKDHVHLLVSIPPTMAVGSAVRIIKANASRHLKQKFPFLKDIYRGTDGVWSEGYSASTVGVNEKIIRTYIESQGQEDAGQAELEVG